MIDFAILIVCERSSRSWIISRRASFNHVDAMQRMIYCHQVRKLHAGYESYETEFCSTIWWSLKQKSVSKIDKRSQCKWMNLIKISYKYYDEYWDVLGCWLLITHYAKRQPLRRNFYETIFTSSRRYLL